ncbi:MAG: N-acetyltransferase [Candidatus Aureabacteria bacterium]|nr:N-acetyltransferase [Candidatus Auribacterota bacterium]
MASIRRLEARDRAAVEGMLHRASEFRPDEVACAMELVDDTIRRGHRESDYVALCAELPGTGVVGFLCYGKTPLTQATYDLYWIVTDIAHRGRGVGKQLLCHLEDILRERGTALLVAETSSLPAYAQARGFYQRKGFREESRIRDFYAPGDDRVIYCKRFERGQRGKGRITHCIHI